MEGPVPVLLVLLQRLLLLSVQPKTFFSEPEQQLHLPLHLLRPLLLPPLLQLLHSLPHSGLFLHHGLLLLLNLLQELQLLGLQDPPEPGG